MKLSPDWLKSVRQAMKERGWNQAELARRAGLSGDPIVSRMFSQEAASTLTVDAVASALQISNPVEQLQDEVAQAWVYAGLRMREIAPERFAELLTMVTTFVKGEDGMAKARGLLDPARRKK